MPRAPTFPQGTVSAAFGRHYEVTLDDGERILCHPRGKKSELACGDRVTVAPTGSGQGVIHHLQPRRSLLLRSNARRRKLMATNIEQLLVVVAVEPTFSEELLSASLVAAESQQLAVCLVLNKIDLRDGLDAARARLAPYRALGYPLVELSAHAGGAELLPHLRGRHSVLVGQSGMGKSTLINALFPDAQARTREISQRLDSGKHTTTHARQYRLDATSRVIDTPGLQEFGLAHLERHEIEAGFREFREHLGHCRFRDCHHENEPGCALQAALARGEFEPRRLAQLHALCAMNLR